MLVSVKLGSGVGRRAVFCVPRNCSFFRCLFFLAALLPIWCVEAERTGREDGGWGFCVPGLGLLRRWASHGGDWDWDLDWAEAR